MDTSENTYKISTKKAVIDCAAMLLQERGYNGWSYEDIAKHVGIRKATIHYYFPKKEDLGKELIVQYSKTSMDIVNSQENASKSPQEKLNTIVNLFAGVLDNPNMFCLCGMLAADLPTLAQPIAQELIHYFKAIELHVQGIFDEGLKLQCFKISQSSAFEAHSLIASFQGMLLLSRMQGGKSQFVDMANNYISKLNK